MLQNQVDIVVRLENLIELQDIGVTNFSQEVDLIMQTKNGLDVVIEHFFVDRLQGKLSATSTVSDLVYLGEVSLSDDVADIVLASEIGEHAEVLHEVEPLLQACVSTHGGLDLPYWCGQNDGLINVSYHDTLLHIQVLGVVSQSNCLVWLLN